MGKVIKKKLNGMNWWLKTSLILLLTLATTMFMYRGWYKPAPAQAATVTYGVTVPSTSSVGVDGSANLSATGSITTAPTVRGALSTTYTTSASSYRPTSGMTSGTSVTLMKLYSPVYATAQTITAPTGSFGIRGYNASDTWTFHIYSYNPAGTAGNKTLMYSSNTTTSGTGSTVTVAPTYTLVNSSMPAGYRLLLEIVYKPGGTTYTPRVYLDGTAAGAWSRLTVTETAASTGNLTIGNGTDPASANAGQGSTGNAINGFTMAMSSGTSTVSTLTVTGTANFTAANIPTNGVKIYRDAGTIGTLDGADTLISSSSTAISGNATTVTLTTPESITTTAAKYLVVVDTNAAATVGNNFTATISSATGTGIGTPVDNDTTSGTLTITAGNVLTIGEGTNPANATAPCGSSAALDSFTLATSSGTSSVTAITVTGSTNFTSTNVGTNGVKIYRDAGTIGTLDGADVLISASSTAISGNATTVTLSAAEAVTSTPANYLVVVDVAAGATLANTFTGTVSGVTGTGYVSATDNDATSATLTIAAAQTLTIGNSTTPANANIRTGNSAALDGFTLALNSGTGSVSTLTLTGSANFTTANISSAAVYADNGVIGTYEAGTDTLIPSTYSQTGTVGTITFTSAEPVSTTPKNYLVVVTANGTATVGNAFTGTITSAAGSGIGTPTAGNTNSATLTITTGPISAITSCTGCHGYTTSFSDGTSRNVPPGQFPGSHNKHVVTYNLQCSVCHITPTTETIADNKHANGQIDMAASIKSGSYQKASGWSVTNTPIFSTCNNTSCHGTTNPTWGAASAVVNDCTICHGATLAGYRRQVTGTGGDFSSSNAYKHINSNSPDFNSCTVCHDQSQHKSFSDGVSIKLVGSVVYDGTATTASAVKGVCINCHNGTGTPFSASGDTTAPYNISAIWPATGGAHDSKMICLNCHGNSGGVTGNTVNPKYNIHDSGTLHILQDSGYDVLNPSTYCFNCHNSTSSNPNKSSKDISAQMALANKHTTAKCFDCHGDTANSAGSIHSLSAGTQTAGSGVIAKNISRATGISMTWSATTWGGATASANLAAGTVTAEYQICFKCHATTGTGTTPAAPYNVGTGAASLTNLALEFNPNNAGRHPVGTALAVASQLTAAKLTGGWTPGKVMTCSDCHATDTAASKGPHGSSVKWMLAGTNKAWPYTAATANGTASGTPFRIATYNTGVGTVNGLFCLNCHTVTGTNNFHSQTNITGGKHGSSAVVAACVSCHIRVPHGGKVSRLRVTQNAPARYGVNGTAAAATFAAWGPLGGAAPGTMKSACSEHSSGTGTEAW